MRYEGCLLTEAESSTLIDEVDCWCRSTGSNYNKLVTAAGVATTTRHKVRMKGQRVTFDVATKLRAAMERYRFGIPRDDHKKRVASIRLRNLASPKYLTADEIQRRQVNREPCGKCGVRADIGCKHSHSVWSANDARGNQAA